MDARMLVTSLWRQRLAALLVLVLTLVTTVVYLRAQPVRYTSTSTAALVPSADPVKSQGFDSLVGLLLPTLVIVASSRGIITTAVGRVPGAPPVETVLGEVSANSVSALLLRVSVTDPDPHMAQALANMIVSLLPAYNLVNERVSFRAVELAAPGARTAPQSKVILLLGALLGLTLACAVAVALEAARRVRQPRSETGVGSTDFETREPTLVRRRL